MAEMAEMDYRVPCRIGWWACVPCGAVAECITRGYPDINDEPCAGCGASRHNHNGGTVIGDSPEHARMVADLHRECWRLVGQAREEDRAEVRESFWRKHSLAVA